MYIWFKTQNPFIPEKSVLEDHIEGEFWLHSHLQNTEKRPTCISGGPFVALCLFSDMGYDATYLYHKPNFFQVYF